MTDSSLTLETTTGEFTIKPNILTYSLWLALMLAGAIQASATIIYSGANRNITYSEYYPSHGTISLFDAPGTWDDMVLFLHVFEDSSFQNRYDFGNLLNVHGNYVEFALGDYHFDIKNFAKGDLIDGSSTYSENGYKDFSDYSQDFFNDSQDFDYDVILENGEFRDTAGYAGLRFIDGDDIYYGWLYVSITNYDNNNITATLIDWAYESTPGVGIQAGAIPEPTTTALLFAGVTAAFVILRRRRA